MPTVSLSVVMPVADDATRLAATLPHLASQLGAAEKSLGDIELIIVDDASRDGTVQCVNEHLARFGQARLIRLPWSCGTGTAARAGVAAATGEMIAFIDDDHRADAHRLTTIVRLLHDADVLVSPRSAAAPSLTLSRRLSSGAYELVARRLAPASHSGGRHRIAALRGDVAKPLFSLLQSRNFTFDVEARVVATSMGLNVVELPVALTMAGSENHPAPPDRVGLRSMARDLLRAKSHRSRALTSQVHAPGTTRSRDPEHVIDFIPDESPGPQDEGDAPIRRQNRAGA